MAFRHSECRFDRAMAQHTIRPELYFQLHRKFITGLASISIDALPCRVERDAVQFTNRIDENTNALACRPVAMADERCIVSRHVSRSSPQTSASCPGGFAATSITICQMLCGGRRRPARSCYCSYVAWGDPAGTSSCRKC